MPNKKNFILAHECQNIIKNNSPEKSIDLISNIKHSVSGEKFGKEKALKIYYLYSDQSVEYDVEKYRFNISKFTNKVNSNIKKAEKYCKKCENK